MTHCSFRLAHHHSNLSTHRLNLTANVSVSLKIHAIQLWLRAQRAHISPEMFCHAQKVSDENINCLESLIRAATILVNAICYFSYEMPTKL